MNTDLDIPHRDDPFDSDPAARFGEPGEKKGGGSWWLVGLGALIVGGGWLGMEWLAPGAQPVESSLSQTATLVRTATTPRLEKLALPPPAQGPVEAVDPAQVRLAYAKVRDAYAANGPESLAGGSKACFAQLRGSPDYALLDFCLAYDLFAETIHRNGEARGPDARWFEEGDARRVAVARAVLNGDPEARLAEVAQLTTTAFIDEAAPAPTAPTVQKAVVTKVARTGAATPAAARVAARTPEPPARRPSALDLKPVPPPGEETAPTRDYQPIPYTEYVGG